MKHTWRTGLLLALFLMFCVTHTYWMPRPNMLIWLPGAFVLGFCMGAIMGQWEKYHLDWKDLQSGQYL